MRNILWIFVVLGLSRMPNLSESFRIGLKGMMYTQAPINGKLSLQVVLSSSSSSSLGGPDSNHRRSSHIFSWWTTRRKVVRSCRGTDSSQLNNNITDLSLFVIQPLLLFLLYSLTVAVLCVAVEDYTGHYTLPSRQLRASVVVVKAQQLAGSIITSDDNGSKNNGQTLRPLSSFGQVTVSGLGFGRQERMLLSARQEHDILEDSNDSTTSASSSTFRIDNRRSYNEIMLEHRESRVPRWRKLHYYLYHHTNEDAASIKAVLIATTQDSIHTLCQILESVLGMRQMATDYQWDAIRNQLESPLFQSDFAMAASQLRAVTRPSVSSTGVCRDPGSSEDVIGFDWGSCAWRKCGALADSQESLDELQARLGLLEPFEVVFCLDIVERSVRDMLTASLSTTAVTVAVDGGVSTLSWNELASPKDILFWNNLPEYKPLVSSGKDNTESHLDDDYMKALQELRID